MNQTLNKIRRLAKQIVALQERARSLCFSGGPRPSCFGGLCHFRHFVTAPLLAKPVIVPRCVMPKRSPVPAMTKNADPQSRIGVRCTPDSFQTFRRSPPVPSKGTLTQQRARLATRSLALLRSRGRPSRSHKARRKCSALLAHLRLRRRYPTERGGPPPLLGLSPGLCGLGRTVVCLMHRTVPWQYVYQVPSPSATARAVLTRA
jgi:hypothetical protein